MKQEGIDDSRILEMLEFGDYNVSMDSKRLEKIKSNEQNIKMSMGEPSSSFSYTMLLKLIQNICYQVSLTY